MSNRNSTMSIALVHGIPGVINTMDTLARRICPGVTVYHLLNEGLFLELSRAGGITPSIMRRLSLFISSAEDAGASVILVTGSTLSPAVDVARKMVSVPILKIDEAMAEEAVKLGATIGLVATEEATVKPSTQIISSKATELMRDVKIITRVSPEARKLFREGNVSEHDALIVEMVKELESKADVIVLAQSSMYSALAAARSSVSIPVFASPELALNRVRQILTEMGWIPQN
ncbi:MAG: aspartate/glutamate racemase family protein [Acetivibrionales bacterium]|jgi:aspartate/glutamate racemase